MTEKHGSHWSRKTCESFFIIIFFVVNEYTNIEQYMIGYCLTKDINAIWTVHALRHMKGVTSLMLYSYYFPFDACNPTWWTKYPHQVAIFSSLLVYISKV